MNIFRKLRSVSLFPASTAGVFLASVGLASVTACSSSDDGAAGSAAGASAGGTTWAGAGGAGTAGNPAAGGSGGKTSTGGVSSAGGAGTTGGSGQSGSGAGTGEAGKGQAGTGQRGAGQGGAGQGGAGQAGAAGAPADFWGDPASIPAAKNVLMFKFLNRTNGSFTDGQVYWRFEHDTIHELHSIAEQDTYDMPANASGRMYFYLCEAGDTACAADPTKSKYYDFIEHTIGADQYNGNTTRVDAFGLKIAIRLHGVDGFDQAVGEDYATFAESRDATFAKYLAAVPAEFAATAMPPNAPYRIVQPGAAGFDKGGAHDTYYDAFVDQLWSANGLTITKPGPNGSGLGSYPDVSAAIYRHVGAVAGTFDANGKLLNKDLWKDATTFYTQAPADYYAHFWHQHGLDGKAYGFPYDDVGGYSTYVSHKNPQYLIVAIGY